MGRGARRTAIVTGATSGIGKEVARKLTELGFAVVLACRQLDAARGVKVELDEAIPNAQVEVGPRLDLSSNAAVRSFVDAFGDRPVSLLINNAGGNHAKEEFSDDNIPLTAQVDYVGPYLLTRLLVPNLQRSPVRARVVNVASVMHRFGRVQSGGQLLNDADEWNYANAKLGLVMFSQEFQKRFGVAIDCCAVDPGGVNTKIFAPTLFGKGMFKWLIQSCYAPPEDAALVVVHASQCTTQMMHGSPFFARGIFAFPAITQYRGFTPDLAGRCLHVLILLMSMLLSLLDYPLRKRIDSPVFREVRAVPPLPPALNSEQCEELWRATEQRLKQYL